MLALLFLMPTLVLSLPPFLKNTEAYVTKIAVLVDSIIIRNKKVLEFRWFQESNYISSPTLILHLHIYIHLFPTCNTIVCFSIIPLKRYKNQSLSHLEPDSFLQNTAITSFKLRAKTCIKCYYRQPIRHSFN